MSAIDKNKLSDAKRRWLNDDESEAFANDYQEGLGWFDECFPNEEQCQRQLLHWLEWEVKKNVGTFICPRCFETRAIVRKKKEDNKSRLVFECKKTNCRSTTSPQSRTIMSGSRLPLRFWFLCIFTIALSKGKIPWSFLDKSRVNFSIGRETKTLQARDIVKIIYRIEKELSDIGHRLEYCRLVRTGSLYLPAKSNFKAWYKASPWQSWRFGQSANKKVSLSDISHSKYKEGEISQSLLLNKNNVINDDWVLVAKANKTNVIKRFDWLYVSDIKKLKKTSPLYKKGYRFVAIQTSEDIIDNDQPFKVGLSFLEAFNRTISESEDFQTTSGELMNPTKVWLEKIFENYPANKKQNT